MLAELVECVKNSWHHCTERVKICKIARAEMQEHWKRGG